MQTARSRFNGIHVDAKIGDDGAAGGRGFVVQKQKMRKSKTIFVIAKSAFRFANALCVRILITTKISTAFIVINYYYCSMRKCADEVVVATAASSQCKRSSTKFFHEMVR